MNNINPKVVALLVLIAFTAFFTFWASKEYFEVHPPTPDTTQGSG